MSISSIFQMIFETLSMTIISLGLAYLFGMPIGLILNITSKKGLKPCKSINFVLSSIVNVLRSIPCLIIVVLLMPVVRTVFGIGTGKWYTIIIPLFVASLGFVARIVEQSLAEVDKGKIEAVRSLGANNIQIVMKVLVPEARSSLISGVAVTFVSILGYTSFAYNIAAGGLISGIWHYYAKNTGNYLTSISFWILIIIVVILVQLVQEVGLYISKKLDKRRI